jgi:hypothetical protein
VVLSRLVALPFPWRLAVAQSDPTERNATEQEIAGDWRLATSRRVAAERVYQQSVAGRLT